MKLTVLVDNNTLVDQFFHGEPGICFYIEIGDKKILFDTGYSDIYLTNAQKLNINLSELDYLVFSHGHLDHTWGVVSLIKLYTTSVFKQADIKKPILIAHPSALLPKILGKKEIGTLVSEEELAKHFSLNFCKAPHWIAENLVFLGEIPRENTFEAKKPLGRIYTEEYEEDDYLLDDSALVYKAKQGLIIITGCSHAGICNIIEYAKLVCKVEKIYDIIGGLHLTHVSDQVMQETVLYMKNLNPQTVHACHCTGLQAQIALSKVVSLEEVGVGLVLEY